MNRHCLFTVAAAFAALTVSASTETEEAARQVSEKQLPNLVKNGSFEKVGKDGRAASWTFWKAEQSQGKVSMEKNAGVNGGSAAVFTSGNGSLFSKVKVSPGDKVYVKVQCCKAGSGSASLTIRFQDDKGKWLPLRVRKEITFAKDGEWSSAEVVVKAPGNAAGIIPMLGASGLDDPDSRIVFDEVEIYNLSAETAARK